MQNADPNRPDISIVRLNEGFVMEHQGYTTAHTTADDLAERVRQVASGVGFSEPVDTAPMPQVVQPAASEPNLADTPRAAAPPAMPRPAQPNLSLEQQWANARQLFAFFGAGFYPNGKAFTRAEFDAAMPVVAPNLDFKEVEYELGEFLAGLHDDD